MFRFGLNMYKIIKYSILNFFWYYTIRQVDTDDLINSKDFRRALTNAMLNSVGLMISDDGIPRFVYLSNIQKKSIKNASNFGYKVGLLIKDT